MKLNELFPHFETRQGQEAMRLAVAEAFDQQQTLLIEAGTGIGKTLAYLLPAVQWALQQGQRTVISTHTIALQQQLIEKDLPDLLDRLDDPLATILLKGMRHYTCLLKQQEQLQEASADHESCIHLNCSHYQQCAYFKQKRLAENALIIVVNHHLLLVDLALREKSEGQFSVLPEYDRLIIDEAHHLEEVATQHFATRISRLGLIKLISRLTKESYLKQQDEIAFHLPLYRRQLFDSLDTFFGQLPIQTQRLTEEKRVLWQSNFSTQQLSHQAAVFMQWLDKMQIPETELKLFRLLKQQLTTQIQQLCDWIEQPLTLEEARWVEEQTIVQGPLNVAPFLKRSLFETKKTIVLCSATLTASKSFSYLKTRLGIEEAKEYLFDSPFDFTKQALLVVPDDLPDPQAPHFQEAACPWIEEAIYCSKGNAFVLFTSYQMLLYCQQALQQKLESKGYKVLAQGAQDRAQLLSLFRQHEGAVLFGTDSFWEGVDVIGDKLRTVILTKLPFKSPTDPLFEARSEWLTHCGKSPFQHYALPQAIVKFRQGFGRLIRHRNDRGSVICLDTRLLKKGYGKAFINSLPTCPIKVCAKEQLNHTLGLLYA